MAICRPSHPYNAETEHGERRDRGTAMASANMRGEMGRIKTVVELHPCFVFLVFKRWLWLLVRGDCTCSERSAALYCAIANLWGLLLSCVED